MAVPGRITQAFRTGLRRRFGLWPVHEARNKTLRLPGAVRAYVTERREIARLRAHVGARHARVVTVVPTFQRPESLALAVASALAQDVADHLVVVVDDGAGLTGLPDDPRVIGVSLSRHTGHSGLVRNVGLGLVDSEFAAFLDDDNTWRNDHLSVALTALDAPQAPGRPERPDVVYTALERVLPDGELMDVLSEPFDRHLMREKSFVDTNSIVARRDRGVRFSRIRRRRGVRPPVDWEFVWRLSRRRRIVHVPEVTVRYAVNPGSYFSTWVVAPDAEGPATPPPVDGDRPPQRTR